MIKKQWRVAWNRAKISNFPEDAKYMTLPTLLYLVGLLFFCFSATYLLLLSFIAYCFSGSYVSTMVEYGSFLGKFCLWAVLLPVSLGLLCRWLFRKDSAFVKEYEIGTTYLTCDFLQIGGACVGIGLFANFIIGFLALVKLLFFTNDEITSGVLFIFVAIFVSVLCQPLVLFIAGSKKWWLYLLVGTIVFAIFNPLMLPILLGSPWAMVAAVSDIVWIIMFVEAIVLRFIGWHKT